MRRRSVATTLVAVTAGLTAVTALHRRSGRHLSAPALPTASRVADGSVADGGVPDGGVPDGGVPDGEGVVLPFVRPVQVPAAASAPDVAEQPSGPIRCGDSGGRTKAGAPCAARATTAGRCHHHRRAA
jgi:hypothetical protein